MFKALFTPLMHDVVLSSSRIKPTALHFGDAHSLETRTDYAVAGVVRLPCVPLAQGTHSTSKKLSWYYIRQRLRRKRLNVLDSDAIPKSSENPWRSKTPLISQAEAFALSSSRILRKRCRGKRRQSRKQRGRVVRFQTAQRVHADRLVVIKSPAVSSLMRRPDNNLYTPRKLLATATYNLCQGCQVKIGDVDYKWYDTHYSYYKSCRYNPCETCKDQAYRNTHCGNCLELWFKDRDNQIEMDTIANEICINLRSTHSHRPSTSLVGNSRAAKSARYRSNRRTG